jgi:Family of unknown function (DUF6220)
MKTAYRLLAYLVALEVVVQAAAIAFATFGLLTYVSGGGVLDRATQRAHAYDGAVGFVVHGVNGQMITPAIALILLIVAFFAKIPGGVVWAALVFGTVVVQVLLGQLAHAVPALGWVHGALAIVLFAVAIVTARRSETEVTPSPVV